LITDILQKMKEHALNFPIILKPDMGESRQMVLLKSKIEQEIATYLQTFQFPFFDAGLY